jgi:hypothetical protein
MWFGIIDVPHENGLILWDDVLTDFDLNSIWTVVDGPWR